MSPSLLEKRLSLKADFLVTGLNGIGTVVGIFIVSGYLARTVPVTTVTTLDEAARLAAEWAQPGDVALFSPACASFDMFDNFEHRGDTFRELVSGINQ